MIKKNSLLCLLFAIIFNSCSTTKITGKELQGYFSKSSEENKEVTQLINSKTELENLTGYATTMDSKTSPSKIDFEKESVLFISLPVTQYQTEIKINKILKEKDHLIAYYQVLQKEPLSYSIKPMLLVSVPKTTVPVKFMRVNP